MIGAHRNFSEYGIEIKANNPIAVLVTPAWFKTASSVAPVSGNGNPLAKPRNNIANIFGFL